MSPADFMKQEWGSSFTGKSVIIGDSIQLSINDLYKLLLDYKNSKD